jgi:hypothetical protein
VLHHRLFARLHGLTDDAEKFHFTHDLSEGHSFSWIIYEDYS